MIYNNLIKLAIQNKVVFWLQWLVQHASLATQYIRINADLQRYEKKLFL